jgi:ribonuclease R
MAVELHALGVPESPRTSAEINQVARMVRGRPVAYAAQLAMLRNFKQARYTLTCDGHFGLAFDRYLHFTSPIRRYADLVTHRVLNAIEEGEPPPYDESQMQRVAHQCSVREREAIQCERESLEMKRTMFYRRELAAGRTGPFRGMIAGVTKSGLVIELLETLQQGFIHFSSIDHDYYVVNRDHTQATGRRFRRTFTLGMAVSVVLAAVEDYGSRVTFRLAESPSEQPRRHRRRR